MTIDIDKLRAAHAATTPGTYWAEKPMPQHPDEEGPPDYNPSVVITAKYGPIARLSVSPCFSPDFIALAHNEFPTLLDEIERLRNAEKTEHDRRLAVETVLVNLLYVINDDKDGGFFICAEAKDRIEDAQDVMGVAK